MVERDQAARRSASPRSTGRRRGRTGARTPPSSSAKPNSWARRPDRDDVGRRGARLHQRDRLVDVLAAAGVGVPLRDRCAPDGERAVVAGSVAVVAVQDVEERRVARAHSRSRVDVRVRGAAFAGDGVDALDVLTAEVVEDLADEAHALVLPDARAQELVELVVGGVDHRAGLGQQRDLVLGLDPAGLEEDLLAVDERRCPPAASAASTGISIDVDPDRLVRQAVARGRRRPSLPRSRPIRRQAGSRRAGWRCRPARRSVAAAAPCGGRAGASSQATGCRAGGAVRPNRSPRRSAPRRAAGGRT